MLILVFKKADLQKRFPRSSLPHPAVLATATTLPGLSLPYADRQKGYDKDKKKHYKDHSSFPFPPPEEEESRPIPTALIIKILQNASQKCRTGYAKVPFRLSQTGLATERKCHFGHANTAQRQDAGGNIGKTSLQTAASSTAACRFSRPYTIRPAMLTGAFL